MAPADWAQRAKDDAERYARENPGKGHSVPRALTASELEAQARFMSETREQFWQRHEDAGTTFGLTPNPPFKRAKRGPSREVLELRARVAELERELAALRAATLERERELAESRAPSSSAAWLAAARAKIAEAAA